MAAATWLRNVPAPLSAPLDTTRFAANAGQAPRTTTTGVIVTDSNAMATVPRLTGMFIPGS